MTASFGKYRGKVVNNVDPLNQGRIQVTCPAVLGEGRASWAMPCTPYAGDGVGWFAMPPNEANVWIEFEDGDPDYPIWTGCFWDAGQLPVTPAVPTTKTWKTDGLTLKIDDLPGAGGVTLEVGPPVVSSPLKISLTSSGIVLGNGAASVKITPLTVSVNDGALEVI
ncbi:MAG TPA: phage baseplate assembly protein V [Microlunatus sp.]